MNWLNPKLKPSLILTFALIYFFGATPPVRAYEVEIATPEQVRSYKASASAHRLRLAAGVAQLLQSKDFINKHPEYAIFAGRIEDAVSVTLNHDYHKANLSNSHPVIQTFSAGYGQDYRSLPEDSPVRKRMKTHVDELNKKDFPHWDHSVGKKFKNKLEAMLLSELVETLDFFDAAETRKAEFGGANGNLKRPFQPASSWITDKQVELGFTPKEAQRMTSIAKTLESDFDYSEIATTYTSKKVEKRGFGTIARSLRQQAKYADMAHVSVPDDLAKTSGNPSFKSQEIAKTPPANKPAGPSPIPSQAALREAELAIENGFRTSAVNRFKSGLSAIAKKLPGFATATGILGLETSTLLLTTTGSTSNCQTPGCTAFLQKCTALKLELQACISKSFLKDLNLAEQNQLRQDPDLDQLLNLHLPPVIRLVCPKDSSTPLQFETRSADNSKIKAQVKSVSPNGDLVASVSVFYRDGFNPNLEAPHAMALLFSRNQVSALQYKEKENSRIRTFNDLDWKTGPSLASKTLMQSSDLTAIKYSTPAALVLEQQADQILSCCQNTQCRGHFEAKEAVLNQRMTAPQIPKPANQTALSAVK